VIQDATETPKPFFRRRHKIRAKIPSQVGRLPQATTHGGQVRVSGSAESAEPQHSVSSEAII